MKKMSTYFLGDARAEPKVRKGVPIRYRPSPKRLECANLLPRVENVMGCAQTQHDTIMHTITHVAMAWGRVREAMASRTGKSHPQAQTQGTD